MKKVLLFLALTLPLGACSTFQSITDAITLGTASVTNPVTPTRLNEMENVVKVAFAGLNTWKQSCIKKLIPSTCRQQIEAVQVYTRQLPPYLAQLRDFVNKNDQINATVVFNNITTLISTVKSQAAVSGVNLGS